MASIESKTTPRAWLVVALLCVVALLNYIDRTMITTMRGSIVDAIPMTDAQFGLLTAVFLWIYGCLSPVAGYMADRFSKSKVVLISLGIWSLVTWMTAYAQTFEQLLLTRALMGISEACYIPAALALIMDYHRGSTRSLATGIHMAGIMAGQSLGFVGGWMAENHVWNTPFWFFGAFGILYSLVLVFLLKDAPTRIENEKPSEQQKVNFGKGMAYLFRQRSFILLLIFFALVSILTWLIVGWLPTYFKEQFGLSQTMAGVYSTAYIFTSAIVGVLLGGFLADRFSRRNPKGRIWVPAIGLLIAAPAIFLASYTTILPMAIVCFITYTVTKSFTDSNTMPILSMVVDPRYRATGYGILNCCGTIVGGIALYYGGFLRDADISLSAIYQFAVLFIIAAAITLLYISPRKEFIEN
ncbi:MFS transporter [Sphingobacterium sp. SGG-5]|uniref:spinster family MFS transporter n=1 Tax=Sphingobacterium sp. SGG-5 TaxID=2710881 RepID=UPI0013EB6AED|nr:MFS transporter [Sphingobacterium sp. SGG-5]NGM62843.1 MFS transporter [Sphingobacterium sp. SGG-5]